MGIMEEIKQHLESGKTVKEIIALGFKAPSVYKVNKQLKDNTSNLGDNDPAKVDVKPKPTKPFPEEGEEVPGTVLDNNPPGPNNSDPAPANISNNPKETKEEGEEGEPLIEELFGDDDQPFRDFDEVDISRVHVDIPVSGLSKVETKTPDQGAGKLGVAELIAQVYSLIGITTGHDHWEVSAKEQKVLKNLCKIPALESALHKFGLYGCAISLITMTLKRVKIEMQLKNTTVEKEDQGITPEGLVRPDGPGTVMGLFEE